MPGVLRAQRRGSQEVGEVISRGEIDTLWQKAMHDSIKDGEDFTRYHFAALVAASERQACVEICRDVARDRALVGDRDGASAASECAETIRGAA